MCFDVGLLHIFSIFFFSSIALTQNAFEVYEHVSLEGIARFSVEATPDACGTKSTPALLPFESGARFDGIRSFDWTTGGELAPLLTSGFVFKANCQYLVKIIVIIP